MTALTPAPHELAALATATTRTEQGPGTDQNRLASWLIGHQQAGVPWPALLRLVTQWLLTGGTEMHELDTALAGWRLQHPNRHHPDQGAR